MARSIQETTGVLGALGSPVKLTCGIALSLVQALHVSSELFTRTASNWASHTGYGGQSSNVLGDRRIDHEALDCDS